MTDVINQLFNYIPEKYRGLFAAVLITIWFITKLRSMNKSAELNTINSVLKSRNFEQRSMVNKVMDFLF